MQAVALMPSRRAADVGVELEHDAKRDDLAIGGAQRRHRALELRREPELGRRRLSLRLRDRTLAAAAPLLGAEVVERGAARDRAEPRACRRARRIEPAPRAQRALERLGGEILGRATRRA